MSEAFAVGQVVQLKSGGQKMTVHEVKNDGQSITCEWFIGKKKQTAYFQPSELKLAEKE